MTATLQMLLDEGIGLYYRCPNVLPDGKVCGHSDVLDAKTLAAVLGPAERINATAHHILCPRCGNLKVEVQPDWPSPGVIVNPIP